MFYCNLLFPLPLNYIYNLTDNGVTLPICAENPIKYTNQPVTDIYHTVVAGISVAFLWCHTN